MGKQTITYEIESPFPDWVTPAVLQTMHDKDGKTMQAIADQFGTSKQNVSNWIKRAKSNGKNNNQGA